MSWSPCLFPRRLQASPSRDHVALTTGTRPLAAAVGTYREVQRASIKVGQTLLLHLHHFEATSRNLEAALENVEDVVTMC